jgi:hypothetical protein
MAETTELGEEPVKTDVGLIDDTGNWTNSSSINLVEDSDDGTVPRGWDNTAPKIFDYAENNVFLGVPNVTQNTLPYIEPFIGGYGRVFMLHAPTFFHDKLKGAIIRMFERFCKGLTGLQNYELTTVDITYGNNAETYSVPTNIKKGNNEFSLHFTELQRGIFRKLIKYWITGISDLASGYATYHGGLYGNGSLVYSPINHTGTFLYALTDNSGGAGGLTGLEFACLWFAAFPKSIPNSHYDYTVGEHAITDLDIGFTGIFHENNTINGYAANLLNHSNFYSDNYNNYSLGPATYEVYLNRLNASDDLDVSKPGFEPHQYKSSQYAIETGNSTETEAVTNPAAEGSGDSA